MALSSCSSSSEGTGTSAAATASPALAAIVIRYYDDLNNWSQESVADLKSLMSPEFTKASDKHWIRDYGFINNARVHINAVRGNSVDYTLDYDFHGDVKGLILSWVRKGTWTFVNENGQWLLNADHWDSNRIVSGTLHGTTYPVQDRTLPNGRHIFHVQGGTIELVPSDKDWQTIILAPPRKV